MTMRHARRLLSAASGTSLATALVLALVFVLAFALGGAGSTPAYAAPKKALLQNPELLKAKAPDVFHARFDTTKGVFVIEVHRAWSPNGADRFYNLVKAGYYDDQRFFRVVPGFVVQWGISGDPSIGLKWASATIKDDPMKDQGNRPGYVTFAKSGAPHSRSTQIFVNLADNSALDAQGFSPFGKIVEGFEVVTALNGEYADTLTPLQGDIWRQGNRFLAGKAPRLDYVRTATIVPARPAGETAAPVPAAAPAPAPVAPSAPAPTAPPTPSPDASPDASKK